MKENINLTALEIYEKQFNVVQSGYEVEEVDLVLDQVIEDYQTYDELVKNYAASGAEKDMKIAQLELMVANFSEQNNQEDFNRLLAANQEFERITNELRSKNQELERVAIDLGNKNQELETKNNRYSQENLDLENRIVDSNEENNILTSTIKDLKDKAEKMNSTNLELNLKTESLVKDNESLAVQNKILSQQKFEIEKNSEDAIRKSEAIHENDIVKIESLTVEIASQKARIAELEDKLIQEQTGVQSYNQLEILKRISRIEQKVFKKD